jgi:predicted nuclease of predicted toxin-antitoxin system
MLQTGKNKPVLLLMKLLLDENLPPQIAVQLQDEFPGTLHVRDIGLKGRPDSEIWDFARRQHYTILTKDSDFHEKSVIHGAPPKVIWIRIGNCSMQVILEWLVFHTEQIRQFEEQTASLLEIRPV